MNFFAILMMGLSLSMDAFAVSVCKGLSLKKIRLRHCITAGLYFGIAQAVMPTIGYFLAGTVAARITDYAPYIAFGLLLLIGANMIREALFGGEEECADGSMSFSAMFPMAIATAIDALAVGVTFALQPVTVLASLSQTPNVLIAVGVIGLTTFVISAVGVRIGNFVGEKLQKTASVIGGSVLILLGVKILLEGLSIL